MMCTAYFGELSETRKQIWDNKETDPYSVFQTSVQLDRKGQNLLSAGSDYFDDKIQIDWGSFAWKCTPEQVVRFLEDYKTTLPWLVKCDEASIQRVKQYIAERPNAEFGIVFIEEY